MVLSLESQLLAMVRLLYTFIFTMYDTKTIKRAIFTTFLTSESCFSWISLEYVSQFYVDTRIIEQSM